MKQWTKLGSSFQIGPQNLKPFINYGNLISQGFFPFFSFNFGSMLKLVVWIWQFHFFSPSKYGDFAPFLSQKFLALPKICGENLS